MEIDRAAIAATFLGEAEEQLAAMEEGLVALEARPTDAELLRAVFRAAHNFKGNASSLGFPTLAQVAHALEGVLEACREGRVPVGPDLISLLLEGVDLLREQTPEAAAGRAEDLLEVGAGLLSRLALHGGQPLPPAPAADASAPPEVRALLSGPSLQRRTLRIDRERLDRMLDVAGELAIASGRMRQRLLAGRVGQEALEAHGESERLLLELQEQVMRARMVPIGPLLRQHARTVRDAAREHGKQARLVVEGREVELDTAVAEQIRDPVTHLVRNALAHGIEAPEERRRLGKDPCGCIRVRARHADAAIVLEVSDDGAGFDVARILARARELGSPLLERTSEQEALQLVFAPGFSTASRVTDLAGRGVGMDVVKRNVEALRGTVSVESRQGQGSTVSLRLPLTLAIIEGFGVGVGDTDFILPLEAVVECLEMPGEAHQDEGGRGVVSLRGAPLPYVRLRELFGEPGARPPRESVVVVRHGAGLAGLAVDALQGERQTVIKPLGRMFRDLRHVSGSAIMGNGQVALILDVPALLRGALGAGAQPRAG